MWPCPIPTAALVLSPGFLLLFPWCIWNREGIATVRRPSTRHEDELQRLPGPPEGVQRQLRHPTLPPVDQEPRSTGQGHRLPRQVLWPRRPHEPYQRRPRPPPPCYIPLAAVRSLRPDREPGLRLGWAALVRKLAALPGRCGERPPGRAHRPDLLRLRRRRPCHQALRHPPRGEQMLCRRRAPQGRPAPPPLQAFRPRHQAQDHAWLHCGRAGRGRPGHGLGREHLRGRAAGERGGEPGERERVLVGVAGGFAREPGGAARQRGQGRGDPAGSDTGAPACPSRRGGSRWPLWVLTRVAWSWGSVSLPEPMMADAPDTTA